MWFARRRLHVHMHLAKNDEIRGREPCISYLSPQGSVWLRRIVGVILRHEGVLDMRPNQSFSPSLAE